MARRLKPPYGKIAFGDDDLVVDLTRRGAKARKGVVVSTEKQHAREGDAEQAITWRKLEPGRLLVVRQGAVIAEHSTGEPIGTPRRLRLPARAEKRTFDIVHKTVYRYAQAIELAACCA